jgi:hypothetical protein
MTSTPTVGQHTEAVARRPRDPAASSGALSYEQTLTSLESRMEHVTAALAAARAAQRTSTRTRALVRVHTAARAMAGITNQALDTLTSTESP